MTELSESAKAALCELALSGPGIPSPSDTMELISSGYATRVVQITPRGRSAISADPGFAEAIVRTMENTCLTLEVVRDALREQTERNDA